MVFAVTIVFKIFSKAVVICARAGVVEVWGRVVLWHVNTLPLISWQTSDVSTTSHSQSLFRVPIEHQNTLPWGFGTCLIGLILWNQQTIDAHGVNSPCWSLVIQLFLKSPRNQSCTRCFFSVSWRAFECYWLSKMKKMMFLCVGSWLDWIEMWALLLKCGGRWTLALHLSRLNSCIRHQR